MNNDGFEMHHLSVETYVEQSKQTKGCVVEGVRGGREGMHSTERHHMVKSTLLLTTLCGCCVNSGHTGGNAQFPSP